MLNGRRLSSIPLLCALMLTAAIGTAAVHDSRSATAARVTSAVQYIGPFFSCQTTSQGGTCGEVETWTMATDTGIVGDVVYISAAGSVRRATGTTATHLSSIGVIVGGASTSMRGVTDSATVAAGTRAALPGAAVLVLTRGRMWLRADTGTGGTIAAGNRIRPPTYITGRAYAWALVAADSNKLIGTAVRAATPGNIFLADISR